MQVIICPNCGESLPEQALTCPACDGVRSLQETAKATQPFVMANANWHKEVDQASHRAFADSRSVSTLPRDSASLPISSILHPSRHPYRPRHASRFRRYIRPSLFFWVSILALTALVMGGLTGLAVTLGRGSQSLVPPRHGTLALEAIPSNVALGAMITLHGSNFSPGAHVGLFRDGGLAILDTGGQSVLMAKADGSFSDTVVVSPNWGAGEHLIQAEDGMLHKTAAFAIQVSGYSASLRPAHLLLSTGSLDLGSDDQTMNSTRTVMLSNVGGGQVYWNATVTQPWLQFSPASGTINQGQSTMVRIAGARSNLKVGSYSAQVLFTSNAGKADLSVRMGVTQLDPAHEAILQISPAVLSFTATDGATNPPAQVVTISNPGKRPLQWSVSLSTNATGTGGSAPGWLSVSQTADTTLSGQSESIIVGVNTASLLPGGYSGVVTFTSQGSEPVQNSPQSVFINLIVLPQCTLQVSPGMLSYSSVYQQQGPAAETVNLSVSPACTAAQAWNIVSAPSWLSFSATSGKAPTSLSVSVVNSSLQPDTYNGSILFNSQAGTQALPVTYVLGMPATPNLSTTLTSMSFTAVPGQQPPAAQPLAISNTGGGILNWTATAATSVGGSWLSVKPGSGSLSGQQSATTSIAVNLPSGIIPGVYSGTITVSGTDGNGQSVSGQLVAVTLVVNAPCSIAASPGALSFTGVAGGQPPSPQSVTITASGACANALDWKATVSGGSSGSGKNSSNWLTTKPPTGMVSLTSSAATSAVVSLNGLKAGSSNATITISATDSVSGAAVGTPVTITITLNVQAACALQPASLSKMTFTTEDGVNPPTQTFTISVSGTCGNNLAITPTVTQGAGLNWLSVTANGGNGGNTMTFTVTVTSASLPEGSYNGSISLSAVDGGFAVLGSPQTVSIVLTVLAPPVLATASPQSIPPSPPNTSPPPQGIAATQQSNATPTTTPQSVTITNNGDVTLNWTATLAANAPSFLSLVTSSGSLAGGANATITLQVNTTGVASGVYKTSITIRASDPLTGSAVQGSPLKIPVTITMPPS